MRIERNDTGTTIWFRQSSLGSFLMCPERARNEMLNLVPRTETDATAIGTSLHAAIESDIKFPYDYLYELNDFAQSELSAIMAAEPTMRWHGTETEARSWLDAFTMAWYSLSLRTELIDKFERGYVLVEQKFDVPLYYDARNDIAVRLEGTPDIIDLSAGKIIDWKTASRPYMRWEKQRWAVQPSVYYAAALISGWIDWLDNVDFDFVTFLKRADVGPETVTVQRNRSHIDWLVYQIQSIVPTLLSDTVADWPKNDQGWWCSEKWCPVFQAGRCKGAHTTNIQQW